VAGQFSDAAFEDMATQMAKGKVKDITVQELSQEEEKVILLDTRELKEYEISHIPNAIWVGYDDFDIDRLGNIDKDTPIITYCSVGYRSERIGEKLLKKGYTNVQNLKGSIFQWVNEGHPVMDKEGTVTKRVHGYNKNWGKWVRNLDVVY